METPVIFKNNKGQQLVGILHAPKTKKKVPMVISIHGFAGSKTRLRFAKLGRQLSEKGIALLRFDCAGHGDSEGEFDKVTLSQQVKDLEAAFKFVQRLNFVDKNKIGLLGESFGGIVVTLFALKYPQTKTLVFWAPALNQKILLTPSWYSPYEIRKWKKQGYIDTDKCRVGIQFLREIENRDFTEEAVKLSIPILIVHGTRDKGVPLKESQKLFKKLIGVKKILIIKGGDHHLERYPIKKKVIAATVNWFLKYLK